jgi:hypothetical protein
MDKPSRPRDDSMLGLLVAIGLIGCFLFEGQWLVPVLTILFIFRGIPILNQRVAARMFNDPIQRHAFLIAVCAFVLGVLDRLSELL